MFQRLGGVIIIHRSIIAQVHLLRVFVEQNRIRAPAYFGAIVISYKPWHSAKIIMICLLHRVHKYPVPSNVRWQILNLLCTAKYSQQPLQITDMLGWWSGLASNISYKWLFAACWRASLKAYGSAQRKWRPFNFQLTYNQAIVPMNQSSINSAVSLREGNY